MTSSSSFWYRSRSKFKFLYLLSNLAEICHMGQFRGADFESEIKNSIRISFEREKGHFSRKVENFDQVLLDKSVAMATP